MKPLQNIRRWNDFPLTIWFLCNPLVTGSSLVMLFGSFLTKLDSTHNLLLGVGTVLLGQQLLSRYQFARTIPYLVGKEGNLFFFRRVGARDAQPEKIEKIEIKPQSVRRLEEKTIPFSDPWNTKHAGFPGIEIYLDEQKDPLTLFFAYGMDRRRDQVFSLLTRWLDGLATSASSRVEYYEDEDLQD